MTKKGKRRLKGWLIFAGVLAGFVLIYTLVFFSVYGRYLSRKRVEAFTSERLVTHDSKNFGANLDIKWGNGDKYETYIRLTPDNQNWAMSFDDPYVTAFFDTAKKWNLYSMRGELKEESYSYTMKKEDNVIKEESISCESRQDALQRFASFTYTFLPDFTHAEFHAGIDNISLIPSHNLAKYSYSWPKDEITLFSLPWLNRQWEVTDLKLNFSLSPYQSYTNFHNYVDYHFTGITQGVTFDCWLASVR